VTTLVVPARCNGPRASGNGGWTAGALAEHVPGHGHRYPVTVRLLLPPPLESPMDVVVGDGGARLEHDGRTVATAVQTDLPAGPAVTDDRPGTGGTPVTLAAAAEASTAYAGFRAHPFPTCFSCGPERDEGDGLRIFPGRLGDGRVAAVWRAHGVDVRTTWAALDCVGGWSSDIDERPMVLGEITVEVLRLPEPGASYVVVGTEVGVEGRRTYTRSELYDAEGDLLAHADHVWVEVDPTVFNALGRGPDPSGQLRRKSRRQASGPRST
jgi:hypothetical protein